MARRTRKPPPPLETIEQQAFVQWFEAQYPGVLIYAVPNGGNRHIATAVRLKKEGVKAGVPDLHIPEWRLRIEMKRQRGGSTSNDQDEIIAYLRDVCGDTVLITRGCDDAIEQTKKFRKETA